MRVRLVRGWGDARPVSTGEGDLVRRRVEVPHVVVPQQAQLVHCHRPDLPRPPRRALKSATDCPPPPRPAQ
jgi:hypothetical protein